VSLELNGFRRGACSPTWRRKSVTNDVSNLDTFCVRGATPANRQRPSEQIEQVEQIVNEINGICRTSSLEFALRVGAVIIFNFYDGDTKAWRDRGPKLHSFRRLATHPDLLVSPGALYRCVAVFELCDRLRAPSRWRRLGASHLRAVLGVPHDRQESLLALANEQRWSVQHLQTRAQELKEDRARGGRRARSPLEKNLRALDQHLRACEGALLHLPASDSDDFEKNLILLTKLRASIEDLGHRVETLRVQLERDTTPDELTAPVPPITRRAS
jgi:hypothetical protein